MKLSSNFLLSMVPIGVLLFLLIDTPNMYETIQKGEFGYFIYGAACDFVTSIACVSIFKILDPMKKIGTILRFITVIWCSIMFFIISYSIIEGYPFEDIIAIILGTNMSEMEEFYSSQFAVDTAFIILIAFLLIVFTYRIIKILIDKIHIPQKSEVYLLSTMLMLSTLIILLKISNTDWTGHAYLKKCSLLLEYESKPNLKDYYSNPSIDKVSNLKTPNLVILIGESLSSDYSSLYGYDRRTQPLLQSLVKKGNLFIFEDVISPAASTLASFKQFMTTYRGGEENQDDWFKSISLIEVLDIIGFKIAWLSNQTKFGFYDNTINSFVECCDTSYFCGSEFDGCNKKTYDGELLKHVDGFRLNNSEPYCLFIHFMGSHPIFNERYPESFERFSKIEYDADLLEKTRQSYAQRDNSILYNDYVVYNIMKQIEDNTIVFYFSDHGLDKDRHGRPSDVQSFNNAIRIPFMLYLSDQVQKNNPDLVEKIKQSQAGEKYSTTNFLYTVMDILGYKFRNNKDVEQYSILNRN